MTNLTNTPITVHAARSKVNTVTLFLHLVCQKFIVWYPAKYLPGHSDNIPMTHTWPGYIRWPTKWYQWYIIWPTKWYQWYIRWPTKWYQLPPTHKSLVCLSSKIKLWECKNKTQLNKEPNTCDSFDVCHIYKHLMGNGQVDNICTSALFPSCGKWQQVTNVCQIHQSWEHSFIMQNLLHPLKHSSKYIPPALTLKISAFNHTVYLCVLCGSQNKQRLFHCTALTDWFV
jgi:hypothetical protein